MTTLGNFNLPLMCIPAYYILSAYPHFHAVMIKTKGSMKNYDNRNPHGSQQTSKMQKNLTARQLATFERSKRCHVNNLENMPLFVAAIFAGLLAEQKAGEGELGLIGFAVGWMGLRTVYTINYIVAESNSWSFVRSVAYCVSSVWACVLIGRAAFVLGK